MPNPFQVTLAAAINRHIGLRTQAKDCLRLQNPTIARGLLLTEASRKRAASDATTAR